MDGWIERRTARNMRAASCAAARIKYKCWVPGGGCCFQPAPCLPTMSPVRMPPTPAPTPSPTLSPTDPVPRGLLTLCPAPSLTCLSRFLPLSLSGARAPPCMGWSCLLHAPCALGPRPCVRQACHVTRARAQTSALRVLVRIHSYVYAHVHMCVDMCKCRHKHAP